MRPENHTQSDSEKRERANSQPPTGYVCTENGVIIPEKSIRYEGDQSSPKVEVKRNGITAAQVSILVTVIAGLFLLINSAFNAYLSPTPSASAPTQQNQKVLPSDIDSGIRERRNAIYENDSLSDEEKLLKLKTLDELRDQLIRDAEKASGVTIGIIDKQSSIESIFTPEQIRILISNGKIDSVGLLSLLYQEKASLSNEQIEILISSINSNNRFNLSQEVDDASYRNIETTAFTLLEKLGKERNYKETQVSINGEFIRTVIANTKQSLINVVTSMPIVFILLFIFMSIIKPRKKENILIA